MTGPTDHQDPHLGDPPTGSSRSDALIMGLTAIGCLALGSMVTLTILWLFK